MRRGGPIAREVPRWVEPVPVREWMTRPAVTVREDTPIGTVAELMRQRRFRHLPVVDSQDHLVGIVTDRDLRQLIFDPWVEEQLGARAPALDDIAARDVMTWSVIAVRADVPIREAARLMHEQKIGALPVVDEGRVVGLLTEHDVLRAFAQLVPSRILTVRPLLAVGAGGDYDYGVPRPDLEPGRPNEGGG